MANSRRISRGVAVLLGASVLVLPGCFTITLWDGAPSFEAKELAGAEVDAAHVLAVDLRSSNGELERFHCDLAASKLQLKHVGRSDRPLPNVTRVVVPESPLDAPVDRYTNGGELGLYMTTNYLRIEPRHPPGTVEEVFIPDLGLDWSKPSNYGRAALTVPAVALDVVTSPLQLVFLCLVLIAHPAC